MFGCETCPDTPVWYVRWIDLGFSVDGGSVLLIETFPKDFLLTSKSFLGFMCEFSGCHPCAGIAQGILLCRIFAGLNIHA